MIAGFGQAAFIPAAVAVIASAGNPARIGRLTSRFSMASSLGRSSAALTAGAIIAAIGALALAAPIGLPAAWRATFLLTALPNLLLLVALVVMLARSGQSSAIKPPAPRLHIMTRAQIALVVAALLSPASLMAIGRVTVDLLGVALTPSPLRESLHHDRLHAERRDRVCAFIAERLCVPALGLDLLVARFGLSRATLYRDFVAWGGLARYIRDQRLERLRERLSSGDLHPIGEIAETLGLDHEGRASDAFRKRFGQRPGAYRRMVARETSLDGVNRRMDEWQSELR